MARRMASSRLRRELVRIAKEPVPGALVAPRESNLLDVFFVLRGDADSVYAGGTYWGKLCFPDGYPMAPPAIFMMTPSGRFEVNTRLCLSMSDFHPETWNPMWNVGTIIMGIQSFMVTEERTTGGITNAKATAEQRRALAAGSAAFNARMKLFVGLFGEDGSAAEAFAESDERIARNEMKRQKSRQKSKQKSRERNREKEEALAGTEIAAKKVPSAPSAVVGLRASGGGGGGGAAVDDGDAGAVAASEAVVTPPAPPIDAESDAAARKREKNRKKKARQKAKKKEAKAAEAAAASVAANAAEEELQKLRLRDHHQNQKAEAKAKAHQGQ
jgi:ubiquitin-conjugating enzyme E2 J2